MVAPFAVTVDKHDEIPGVGITAVRVIIAEVGIEMSRFPTAAHLGSDFYDHRIGSDRKTQPHPSTRSPRLQGHSRTRGLSAASPVPAPPHSHAEPVAPFDRTRLDFGSGAGE
ncbi:MAG: hypothetical protein ACRDTG_21170 [Pseudonocardiaceae bacterium]